MRRLFLSTFCALFLVMLVVSSAFADNTVTYVVKPGDTLGKIARDHGTTVNAIASLNAISNRNVIFPGEFLIIPSRLPHVLIDRPGPGEILPGSVRVTGRSTTFEGAVALQVLDRNFSVVGTGNAMGGSMGTYGNFAGDVTFAVPFAQVGYVEAFEVSARDGSAIQTDSVPVLLAPSGGRVIRYTVRFGDTLTSIARRFGVSIRAIARANHIININRIFAGQVLVIPR